MNNNSAASPVTNRHTWEQWDWVWHTVAYSLMVLNLIVAANNLQRRGTIEVITQVSVVLAAWYVPFMLWPTAFWTRKLRPAVFYFIAGWVIWLGLVYLHPPAMMLAAFFYPQVFLRMPFRWALTGAVFLTGASFWVAFILDSSAQMLPSYLLFGGLLVASQIILSIFIYSLIAQSNQRYNLLQELQQTRSELARAERDAGVLAERQRMAHEIHDTLAQDFTSIIMHLTAAQLSDSSKLRTHLEQAEQTAREGLDEARRIVWALRPEQLERASFVESIEQIVVRFSVENAIKVKMVVTGTPAPLDPDIEAELFRITQEALQNVKKHAQASNVNITLSYMTDLIALDIIDDGSGFTPGRSSGFGLQTMRERVEKLGGTFFLESEEGTAIAVSVPVKYGQTPNQENSL